MSTILLETTDATGEVADWLDDTWWSKLFQQCAPNPLTIEIAPTCVALTHPVVLHQLEMVRRIVANWRIIGEGYANDFRGDDEVEQLATGPYHELRFHDGGRADVVATPPSETNTGADELIARIRARTDRTPFTSPNLVRLAGRNA